MKFIYFQESSSGASPKKWFTSYLWTEISKIFDWMESAPGFKYWLGSFCHVPGQDTTLNSYSASFQQDYK